MANRFSRSEKGKWASDLNQTRRPSIVIPEPDNNELIEANRFTLIGRVTNPNIQKTRALVDFFLQHWSVVGHFKGRELGPYLFQFTFESERDLQAILNKAPFHFKRWMILLQRWEPVISDDFPSSISFWVRIHGLPLHYWTDATLHMIGSELGVVESKDVHQARIRVHVNGLKPLVVLMDITLGGESKVIEVEYENIGKHCFLCCSLSHEKENCPQKHTQNSSSSDMRGINETRTLESLEAYRRGKDDRKLEKVRHEESHRYNQSHGPSPRHHSHGVDLRSQRGDRRRSPPRSSNYQPQYPAKERDIILPRGRDGTRDSDRSRLSGPSGGNASHRIPASQRLSHEQGSAHSRLGGRVWVEKGSQSQTSHTPPPRPQWEAMTSNQEVNSSSDRRSALVRLSLPITDALPPGVKDSTTPEGLTLPTRVPALQRIEPLSVPERTPLLQNGVANSESGRLQEVEIQYMEESFPAHILHSSEQPSSSRLPAKERLSLPQESPIRTLSEDRRHLASTLPVLPTLQSPAKNNGATATATKAIGTSAASKVTGKRKAQGQPAVKKRAVRSSLHGVSLKMRRVNKAQISPRQSPRRKLYGESSASEDVPAASKRKPKGQARKNPPINLIPAMTRQGTDFRSARSTLP